MRLGGVRPTERTYKGLGSAYAEAGRVDLAEHILETMRREELRVEPWLSERVAKARAAVVSTYLGLS